MVNPYIYIIPIAQWPILMTYGMWVMQKKKKKKAYLVKQGNRSWPSKTVTLNFDPKSWVNPFEKI